jgi:autotransporter translocation and assembly factor TamB
VFLQSDQLEGINPINFSELSASIRIANRRVFIDEMKILSDLGDWKARGSIGFDAGVGMAVSIRLSKQVSGKVLDVEGAAKEAAKRLLAGTQLSAAAGLFDNLSLIPHDKEGRISLKFALSGTVSAPQVGSLAFGDIGRQGNGTGGQAVFGSDGKWKNDSREEMIKKNGRTD